MKAILSALLAVFLCATASHAQPNGFVELAPQPSGDAWWLRAEFHPADVAVRGIPVGKLRATWCKATEFRKDLFPSDLAADFDQTAGLSFAADGFFDGSKVKQTALVGAYEACNGKRGSFLLVLAWRQANAPMVRFVHEMSIPFAMLGVTNATIVVFHCMECDHVTEFKWDAASMKSMTAANASRIIETTSETVSAATITTMTPDPISSEVMKLNAASHSPTTISAPRISTVAMRRTGLFLEPDCAAEVGVGVSAGVFMLRPNGM